MNTRHFLQKQRSLIQGASFRGSPQHADAFDAIERSPYQSEYPKSTNPRTRLLVAQRRKSIRNISAKVESSEDLISINTKQKTFRQSLQKLYEEHFIKNLIDRSYTRKLAQLSNYQTQVLDDLQFGYDQEIIDTDNGIYNFISKYLDVIGVISPQSTFKLIWNFISLFTCITLYIWLPYKMAFELNFVSQLFSSYAHLTIEPVLITVLAGDIVISCNEAYISKGMIIQQRYYIIRNYLRTGAFFDLAAMSSMIYMLIEIHKQADDYERSYMSLQVCLCLYFGLYKGIKLSHILTQIQDYFNIQGNILEITFVIKIFIMILYLIHVIGCIWYGIGIDGWVKIANMELTSNSFKYATAIHWASVYLCSVGSANHTPTNINEFFFASFVSFLSLIMIAIMSITVGQFAYNFAKAHHNQVKVMKNFMLNNKIDFNLQVRIKNYLDYICNEEKSMKDEDVSDIIGRLSTKLQSELMLELRSSLLQQCTVISKQFSEKLQRQLISQMEEVQTVPEQRIIIQDEIDDSSIYMISKGEVDIVFESRNKIGQKEKRNIIKNLQKSEFFGFYGFITGFGRTATVISRGCCRLYKIPRQQFLKVLESFPNDKEIFNEMRDELSHNGDYSKLGQRCYSCKSFKHLAKGCNYLHYVPDSDRVIKQFNFPHLQERDDPIQPRTTRFINALLSQQILYQIAMQRQLDNLDDVSEHTNNVFLQEEDSTTQYSQMRSISRSMSQFSKHSQMQIPSKSIDASNFDEQVADRRPVQRKKDQKNTVETAGFGFRSSRHSSSAEDEIEELSDDDDIDEEEEDQQSSESSHRQQMINNNSKYKGSSSPKVSQPSNLSKRSSVNNKVTFNSDEFQVLRNSIKRKSTKTTNTAIVVEKALQSLNDLELNIKFAILTQPSVGDFDKMTVLKFYFPQFNIQNVLKRIKNPPKEQYSLYTFILAALQKALQLRNASEPAARMMQKQSIFRKLK